MNVKPLESSPHLPPATLATLAAQQSLQLDMLRLEPAKQGYRVSTTAAGSSPTTTAKAPRSAASNGGDVLAQCTITSLPPKSAGRQTTLEEFEHDIRLALKENFGELVSSRQWTNSFGHHCLEVVVRGTAEEVPIEWHYYLVAPGKRQPRLDRRHDPRRNGRPPRRRRPQTRERRRTAADRPVDRNRHQIRPAAVAFRAATRFNTSLREIPCA